MTQEKTPEQLLEENNALIEKEKQAALNLSMQKQLPYLVIGMLMVFLSFFFTYAGNISVLEVLFNTPKAQKAGIGLSEVAYVWSALVAGFLLTLGSILSRSSMVVMANWVAVGIAWFLGVFAIWMRQTEQTNGPMHGVGAGLLLGVIGLTVLLPSLASVLSRRSAVQKKISEQRRKYAHATEQARAAQHRLRTGLDTEVHYEIPDDRRAAARRRREVKQAKRDSHS